METILNKNSGLSAISGLAPDFREIEEASNTDNEMAKIAKELWKKMDIQYDDYIQTTEERHTKIVQKIFDKFMEQGDIYKGEYEGK